MTSTDDRLTPMLTPQGRLVLLAQDDAPVLEAALAGRLQEAFSRGGGHGLLRLGAAEVGSALPPVLAWWRAFGGRFVTAMCTRPEPEGGSLEPEGGDLPPPPEDLAMLALAAPLMSGAETLTAEVLRGLWEATGVAFARERAEAGLSLPDFLKRLNPAWNVVGRVHFNLAENRRDEQAPFAFLATYTHRLSGHGKAQHLPLGQALREYADAADKEKLLSLLLPVQRAAAKCDWLRGMLDAGEIFHPLRWSPQEALRLLGDVPSLEQAGVVIRMPATWRGGRPARPQVTATVGAKAPSVLGAGGLLDFSMALSLDGAELTEEEVRALLDGTGGLSQLRGQWVEVDRERLGHMMDRFREAQRLAGSGGLPFSEAMRLLSGTDIGPAKGGGGADPVWSGVVAGPWLAETLAALRAPAAATVGPVGGTGGVHPGSALRGTLRPYQESGVRWLHLLSRLGLGACLADDMGLGKTIQVLSLLVVLRREREESGQAPAGPSLLVAPASLLANWAAELARFTPDLRALVAHPSAMGARELSSLDPARLLDVDLVITTYGGLLRLPWIEKTRWDLAVLDEAQAIKNPQTRQTHAVKKLDARVRIALSGTPVENRLGDLWSIFDFLNPGLLGTAKDFTAYTRRLGDGQNPYGPLRDLVRPYILRRLKTDRRVIADLPDKTEVKAYCPLTKKQAALYRQAVDELAAALERADGIGRKGVVLSFLMRLKQICNHPSQWLGDGAWAEAASGKWERLRELAEVIASRQDKALVFTQFREVTAPLAAFLGGVFGRPGLVLHGNTPVKARQELVRRFQEDEAVPFFVLSLKAGGSGLNLTAASHVIHFDRWWNPAVENQATDRAFRIGQTKNVLVHKFVCRGTVEERIDELIESKRTLLRDLVEGGAEVNLTEMTNEQLMRLVSLDLHAAMKE